MTGNSHCQINVVFQHGLISCLYSLVIFCSPVYLPLCISFSLSLSCLSITPPLFPLFHLTISLSRYHCLCLLSPFLTHTHARTHTYIYTHPPSLSPFPHVFFFSLVQTHGHTHTHPLSLSLCPCFPMSLSMLAHSPIIKCLSIALPLSLSLFQFRRNYYVILSMHTNTNYAEVFSIIDIGYPLIVDSVYLYIIILFTIVDFFSVMHFNL